MNTIKGLWYHPNKVLTDSGNIIKVYPYGIEIERVEHLLPMECYILLKEMNTVVNWIKCM